MGFILLAGIIDLLYYFATAQFGQEELFPESRIFTRYLIILLCPRVKRKNISEAMTTGTLET